MFKTAEEAFEGAFLGRLMELEGEGSAEFSSPAIEKVASAFGLYEEAEDEEPTYDSLMAKLAGGGGFMGKARQDLSQGAGRLKSAITGKSNTHRVAGRTSSGQPRVSTRFDHLRAGVGKMKRPAMVAGVGAAGVAGGVAAYKALKNRKKDD